MIFGLQGLGVGMGRVVKVTRSGCTMRWKLSRLWEEQGAPGGLGGEAAAGGRALCGQAQQTVPDPRGGR